MARAAEKPPEKHGPIQEEMDHTGNVSIPDGIGFRQPLRYPRSDRRHKHPSVQHDGVSVGPLVGNILSVQRSGSILTAISA